MDTDQICSILRERICFLDYPPGARLGEIELAAEFGVSRTPVRSALAVLEADGLVDIKRGMGTVVTQVDWELLLQTQQLRRELATLLFRLSPSNDFEPIGREVSRLIDQCIAVREHMSVTDFARLNARFFELMMRLTNNQPLRDVSRRLYYLTARAWLHAIPELSLADEIEEFIEEMSEVRTALDKGDLTAIGYIRWLHLSKSIDRQKKNHELIAAFRSAS